MADFEREMQKALNIIFKNIHALDENRNQVLGKQHYSGSIFNERQPRNRSKSLPGQRACHFSISAAQGSARRKKISL